MLRFFDYLDTYAIDWPSSPDDFDHVTGEYINHLYQEMDPYGYAGDFLSGIRRFLPRWRSHTHAATQYFRNWRRTLSFRQALPLPADVILGIAGVALAENRPRIAVAFLGGFVGLLCAAKGRSSSKVLNRVCRRVMAISLATNTYVITLWTISKWDYSDAAGRLRSFGDGKNALAR